MAMQGPTLMDSFSHSALRRTCSLAMRKAFLSARAALKAQNATPSSTKPLVSMSSRVEASCTKRWFESLNFQRLLYSLVDGRERRGASAALRQVDREVVLLVEPPRAVRPQERAFFRVAGKVELVGGGA